MCGTATVNRLLSGVGPGRRQFVAQAQAESESRRYFPGIVDESRLGIALELGVGQRHRNRGLIDVTQQKLGKCVASCVLAELCVAFGWNAELAARKLVSDLIEVLPRVFETETEGVLAVDPGQIVDRLSVLSSIAYGPSCVSPIAEKPSPAKETNGTPQDTGSPGWRFGIPKAETVSTLYAEYVPSELLSRV